MLPPIDSVDLPPALVVVSTPPWEGMATDCVTPGCRGPMPMNSAFGHGRAALALTATTLFPGHRYQASSTPPAEIFPVLTIVCPCPFVGVETVPVFEVGSCPTT